ncbi:1-acyl-sn-glycerol-3-phosphate acyltransferase [Plantibacter flavus]|uniref:1-acyl-sn-glycerol-3-phosphate acyltransferase n=1 Tax=Plantibacter flavus TaxID=150123 RepID=A0A3N2C441_9MICO|nr:lysophospholipid acyltransferase family protein [Plantibacter flavus]ROR82282.1 1-acyl-sn-glycerol-3-phosphate acyltransferase [Plantibacter flavus]SMG42936.1 1-acyl-sn-glycerol-3-phosphate acyltransferase [Plantibacter flavus]
MADEEQTQRRAQEPSDQTTVEPSTDAAVATPSKPGVVYYFGRAVLNTTAKLLYRPKIIGRKNVPKRGPVILASNHLSFIDSIAIPISAPRRVQFLAKSDYFTGRGLKGWVSRTFFTSIGAVGVERGVGQAAQEALDQGRRILESGEAFAIYPEGTRSLDGRLYRGRTGVAWLALTTGATVVPVGLIGTDDLMPVGTTIPKFKPVTVIFGEPIDVSHHGPATSGRARRKATDEIMAAIHALTGQELANAYNESPPADAVERIKRAFRPERL